METQQPASAQGGARFSFAVNVLPKEGILDPQGRAVEQSLPHLGLAGIGHVRVGRRVELFVIAADADAARGVVEHLASELLCNPMIEQYAVEALPPDPPAPAAAAPASSAAPASGSSAASAAATPAAPAAETPAGEPA